MCSVSKAIELYPHFIHANVEWGLANGNTVHDADDGRRWEIKNRKKSIEE